MSANNQGTAQQPKGTTFPWITAADTRIVLAKCYALNLQGTQLRGSSRTFEEMIPAGETSTFTAKASKGGAFTASFLVLQDAPVSGRKKVENAMGFVLQPMILKHRGMPLDQDAAEGLPADLAGTPELRAFYDVLGAFYSVGVDVGPVRATRIDHIFNLIDKMVQVAEYLQCMKLITNQIEAILLSPGNTTVTYCAIATSPLKWLHLADRLKSKRLFSESLIHAAGHWNTDTLQSQTDTLREPLLLLRSKGEAIRKKSQDAYLKLASHYPLKLQRERTLGIIEPKSNNFDSYRGDIGGWLALTIFRTWANKAVANDETYHAPDMGWEFWRKVEEDGEAYLNAEEVEEWFEQHPISGKGPVVVREELKALKEEVKKFTGSLFMECSVLKTSEAWKIKHFTCTFVYEEDYLWVKEDRVAEGKRRSEARHVKR